MYVNIECFLRKRNNFQLNNGLINYFAIKEKTYRHKAEKNKILIKEISLFGTYILFSSANYEYPRSPRVDFFPMRQLLIKLRKIKRPFWMSPIGLWSFESTQIRNVWSKRASLAVSNNNTKNIFHGNSVRSIFLSASLFLKSFYFMSRTGTVYVYILSVRITSMCIHYVDG